MQQQQAYDLLPADATWFSSFGYPGRDNFRECWRRPNGEWWTIIKRDEDWSIESREG